MMMRQSGGKMTENGEVGSHFCRLWHHHARFSPPSATQSSIADRKLIAMTEDLRHGEEKV
ncbi:hypothetical protein ACQR1L_21970 [Bradyrhizobium sp. HKCCYLR20261]